MKKVIVSILSVLIILAIIIGAVYFVVGYLKNRNDEKPNVDNPNNNEDIHIHSYSEYWSTDAREHWHCANCDTEHGDKDRAEHTFDENEVCTVCKYDATGGFVFEKIECDNGEAWAVAGVKSGNQSEYLTIPSEYRKLSVKKIGSNALSGSSATSIKVNIPDSITDIASDAFANNEILEEVNFILGHSQMSHFDDKLFFGCTNLKTIYVPDKITSIGVSVFEGCIRLSDVYINKEKSHLESIGEYAFKGCRNLINIYLPRSLNSLESYAFYECSGLVNIAIHSRIKNMGYGVFAGCRKLKICCEQVSQPNEWDLDWNSDDLPVIWDCRQNGIDKGFNWVLTNSSGTVKIIAYSGNSLNSMDIKIPSTINGYSVTSIEDYAFENCRLKTITFEENCRITSIGNYAFSACNYFTSINIPDSVTSIGDYAFYNCNKLTTVRIEGRITSIGNSVFRSCGDLNDIKIPDSVTNIGEYAFANCSSLTTVSIPQSVTTIGREAFSNSDLTICCEAENKPDGWDSNWTSSYCTVIWDCKDYGITESGIKWKLTVSEVMTIIGYSGTPIDVVIPDIINDYDVKCIGDYAFRNCESLKSIVLSKSLTSIGDLAFHGCASLTSVFIPKSVTSVGTRAFIGCDNLTIYCECKEEDKPEGFSSSKLSTTPVVWGYDISE